MWYLAGLYLTGWMLSKSLILQRVSFSQQFRIQPNDFYSDGVEPFNASAGGDSSKSIINERNKIMLSCMRWDTQIPPRSGFHAQSQRWTNRVRNQSPDEIWKMESSIFRPCSVSTFFVPNSTPNQEVQNHGRSILSTNQATKTKVGDDENPPFFHR